MAALRRIACPTLLLVGSEDPIVPVDFVREASALIPGSEVVVVDDAGHSAYFEKAAEFNRHVADFVARRGAARRGGGPVSTASASPTYGLARYDFAGAVAVVTGGASGIGAEVVHHLRRAGARVAVWDLAVPGAEADEDEDAWPLDVTDLAAVERAAAAVAGRFGRIGFVVNRAGFAGPTVPVTDDDPGLRRRIVDVNRCATFNVCRATVPWLQAAGGGRIVNIASLAGKEGTPNASAYSAAKAGVLALTKSLGKELATTGSWSTPLRRRRCARPSSSRCRARTCRPRSPRARCSAWARAARLPSW